MDTDPKKLRLIVYTSEYRGDPGSLPEQLAKIETAAKRRNPKLGITGVLFHHNGRFVQILEGEPTDMQLLMSLIQRDRRHHRLNILIDEIVHTRGFGDWNMDIFDLDDSVILQAERLERIRDEYLRNLKPRADALAGVFKKLLTAMDDARRSAGTS